MSQLFLFSFRLSAWVFYFSRPTIAFFKRHLFSAAENKDTGMPNANVSRVVTIPQVPDLPSGVSLSVPSEISQAASQISDAELMMHLELLTILFR